MILDELRRRMPQYSLEIISEANLGEVYAMLRTNAYFYQRTQEHAVTVEECRDDITALPPGKSLVSKAYFAVYEDGKCLAAIDFIEGYPDHKTGYLGLFIVDAERHGQGIGTKILNVIEEAAKELDFQYLQLACHETNEKGFLFWLKKGFREIRRSERKTEGKVYQIISLQKELK